MADPFLGEIRQFAGNFAPNNWALCNGQLLPISRYTALFSLLGTMYGGDGKTTFALPNLMGSAPMHYGQGPGLSLRSQGEQAGEANVTLLQTEIPAHTHTAKGGQSATTAQPDNAGWGTSGRTGTQLYTDTAPNTTMHPLALQATGGTQPHNNMQPYITVNYIIALQGIFPQRP
ncbi:Tail Collar domain protein [Paenibacillus curdlanolyticus YK9]|uniref:Tail Collar domain protein n=1 Tax=Paenibacillus curdlanolyticus YK9 TaxID=717606 RepID=E0I8Z8_9BACL|nr:tail fiber protein [Paenibacillus curdlanolyticus]EFM10882.1 Tail Collar domain protein [Paenibacillus curdlanolyticus YK9]